MRKSIQFQSLLKREIDQVDMMLWARKETHETFPKPLDAGLIKKNLIKRLPSILMP